MKNRRHERRKYKETEKRRLKIKNGYKKMQKMQRNGERKKT